MLHDFFLVATQHNARDSADTGQLKISKKLPEQRFISDIFNQFVYNNEFFKSRYQSYRTKKMSNVMKSKIHGAPEQA